MFGVYSACDMKELQIFKILFLVISDIQKRNQGGE